MVDLVEMGHDVAGMVAEVNVPPHFDRAAVSLIRRNLGGVLHLVNELLDVTRIGPGKIDVRATTVDFHEAIRFVVRNHESQRKAKLIAIHLHLNAIEHHISADPEKLQQVLTNLIGNAIKFTSKAGNVSIVSRNETDRSPSRSATTASASRRKRSARSLIPSSRATRRFNRARRPRFRPLHRAEAGRGAGGHPESEEPGLGEGSIFTLLFQTEPLLVRAS